MSAVGLELVTGAARFARAGPCSGGMKTGPGSLDSWSSQQACFHVGQSSKRKDILLSRGRTRLIGRAPPSDVLQNVCLLCSLIWI